MLSRALGTAFPPLTRAARLRAPHGSGVRSVSSRTTARVSRRQLSTGMVAGLAGSALVGSGSRGVASAATSASEIEQVLLAPKWPEEFPFRDEMFERYDEAPDTEFYSEPRLVYHIDERAVGALTNYYAEVFPASGNKDVAILDICSSWVSHFPEGYTAGRVAGLGMNGAELAKNPQLTEYSVKDLNADPVFPYEDNSFDVITNCVSVDYLNKPLKVFKEMQRCLKPGGTAIMSFSNRCFPTKAISLWTQTGDEDHVYIVEPKAKDISPTPGRSDPMYVVYGSKLA
eukprot:gene10440-8392_t